MNPTPGLPTNRLLWRGASARALSLRGSGCRNLALRAFMNKPRYTPKETKLFYLKVSFFIEATRRRGCAFFQTRPSSGDRGP